MPNHTMFLKYSRKRETRGQSCQGFVLHSERKGNLFSFPPRPWHPCWKQSWLCDRVSSDNPKIRMFLLLYVGRGSRGGEVCAYPRGQVWKPPERIPETGHCLSWAVSSGRGSDTHVMSKQHHTHKVLLVPHVPAQHSRGQEVCFSNHGRGCARGNIHSWRGTRHRLSVPTPGR